MSTHTPERAAPEHVSIGGWIARTLVLVVFVPPRLLWEAIKRIPRLVAAAFGLFDEHLAKPLAILFRDWVFRPLRNFVRRYLWHLLIQQLLFGMVLTPLGAFLLAYVLRPIQRAIEEWVWRRVLKPGIPWIFRNIVRPVARAIAWTIVTAVEWLIVIPISAAWRRILYPGGRWFALTVLEPLIRWLIVRPLEHLWRWVLRPLVYALLVTIVFGWRVATTVVAVTVVAPCRWLNRTVLQPLFAAIARA
ncbi:hypothetical protein [Nocardia seriolae]|nr:hypothetical protein [Nocardia seriolae]OJF80975.1 hypothetical protein NS14008_19465 [Nocardia seriolae]PSK28919.1 hypothetical protein C6575_24030 [Nocardia seriolae]QOW35054.1 hypothetical protein IMZ23_08760 [Nocardia seriolae]QUN17482.1 hypothetical protein KEC46_36230 [Nocardia seriolae]WNJ62317.1 hypothetical protein RMO66_17455 [Nocardia seriolae]